MGGQDQGPQRRFDSEEEKFDGLGAGNLMSSKHTQSKINSLFLDTKVFNMSSAEYIPELSLPGALERLNSDDGSSPLEKIKRDQRANFRSLREGQRESNDVAHMTQLKTMNSNDISQQVSYNRDTKVCIPAYNIKAYYNHDLHPFFSPERRRAHRNTDSAMSLHSSAEKLQPTLDSARERDQSQSRFASKTENMQSNVTISSVHVDPELLAKRNE